LGGSCSEVPRCCQSSFFIKRNETVAEGFQLKTWRGGPEAGKPKISPVAKGFWSGD
jgi:hypothetical protein